MWTRPREPMLPSIAARVVSRKGRHPAHISIILYIGGEGVGNIPRRRQPTHLMQTRFRQTTLNPTRLHQAKPASRTKQMKQEQIPHQRARPDDAQANHTIMNHPRVDHKRANHKTMNHTAVNPTGNRAKKSRQRNHHARLLSTTATSKLAGKQYIYMCAYPLSPTSQPQKSLSPTADSSPCTYPLYLSPSPTSQPQKSLSPTADSSPCVYPLGPPTRQPCTRTRE